MRLPASRHHRPGRSARNSLNKLPPAGRRRSYNAAVGLSPGCVEPGGARAMRCGDEAASEPSWLLKRSISRIELASTTCRSELMTKNLSSRAAPMIR